MATLVSLIIIISLNIWITQAGFVEEPTMPENVTLGSIAKLRCIHETAFSIIWNISLNGAIINPTHNEDFTPGFEQSDRGLLYTLSVLALPQYNGTLITCIAVLPNELSRTIMLVIHGTCARTLAFVQVPKTTTVIPNVNATFNCHHRTADLVDFEIDGEPSAIHNVTIQIDDIGRHVLLLLSFPIYDGAEIVCTADFFNGCEQQETEPALLLIQGPLRSVTDFRRGSPNEGKINFFWTPPPTLDLTNVEPDIVYCVEVYDITCGKTEYLSGPYDCDLLNPVYDADLDADKIYLVKVIARSNVVGAMNGTTLITTEKFGGLNIRIRSMIFLNETNEARITFDAIFNPPILPPWYIVMLDTTDGLDLVVKSINVTFQHESVMIDVPSWRLWDYSVLAYGCELSPGSGRISSHNIQDVNITSAAGEIRIRGDFVTSTYTDVTGLLAVVYPVNSDNKADTHFYQFLRKPDGSKLDVKVMGLRQNQYFVSVFELGRGGLPISSTAHFPQHLNVDESHGDKEPGFQLKYKIEYGTETCVTCIFQTDSATYCVAVVHRRISLLNSTGLLNIISSHKINRTSNTDTAYDCIYGVNTVNESVGVIGGELMESGATDGALIIGSTIGSIVAAVVAVSILVLCALCCYRINKTTDDKKVYQPTDAEKEKVYQPTDAEKEVKTPKNVEVTAPENVELTKMKTIPNE